MKKSLLIAVFAFFALFMAAIDGTAASLPQIRITCQGVINPDDYIPGTINVTDVDGSEWNCNIELRRRGSTAKYYTVKPALNIKLRDGDGEELDHNLLGLRTASSFILDAMAIDRINMRNRICFDIWNEFSRLPYDTDFDGRNGTVGRYVEVYIDGSYKGIYCLTDKINRKLLDLKKPETDAATGETKIRGLLYKNGTSDVIDESKVTFLDDYLLYVASPGDVWELHEPEELASPKAWEPIIDFYADGNCDNYEYIKQHFWVENLADFAVHVLAMSLSDNWKRKNKYFSIQNVTKSGDKSRFVVTPWDMDTSLGGYYDGSFYNGNYSDWKIETFLANAPVPFAACIREPEFVELMKQRWLDGRDGPYSIAAVSAKLRETAALFIESGAWQRTLEKQPLGEEIVTDLEKEIEMIIDWYKQRHAIVDGFFGITTEDAQVPTLTDGAERKEDIIFNMQGIRLKSINSPGIYIINGKKTFVGSTN